MARDKFIQRKEDVLSKSDKSSIGGWDERIEGLCNKINRSEDFYTTSSCSGRIILMVEQDKKSPGLFVKVWHNKIHFGDLEKVLKNIVLKSSLKNKIIKFKTEPPIVHVACRDLDLASELLEKAKHAGFKRSGILSFGKNIILELNSTEKIEFPIINKNEVLVGEKFLKMVVSMSNSKLEKGWDKIESLKKDF